MQRDRRICVWIFIIITLLSIDGCQSKEGGDTLELREAKGEQKATQETAQETEPKEKQGKTETEEKNETEVLVHVCGQVQSPGVYRLKGGSRIFEALEAAGGILDSAAGEALNQAETVADGQQIYVPAKEETGSSVVVNSGSEAAAISDGKVNINTASKEELMTLNGIGASRADSIVRYREEHGGFTSIEELKEIEGIKDGIFNKLKDLVKAS